jgi:hypothetical protein
VLATAALDRLASSGMGLLVASAVLPRLLTRRQFDRERERLRFYWPYADAGDADRTFLRPPAGVPVQVRRARRGQFAPRDIPHRRLSFDSPFVPLHPELQRSYLRHARNRRAHALHYYHPDGPRPTLIFLHGYTLPQYRINGLWFCLPWFYRKGYDVLLAQLPFHGERRERGHPFSGYGFFADGFAHFNEAVLQGVHDVRVWLDYLLGEGAPGVGVSGLSLGGYITSAVATVEERLAFAIPNSPVVSLFDMARQWQPSGRLLDFAVRRSGATLTELRHGVALHSPLTYAPRLPAERQFIIAGAGDRFTAPRFVRQLHEHWQGSRLHWFPGNHLIHVQQGDYLRRMKAFMDRHSHHSPPPPPSPVEGEGVKKEFSPVKGEGVRSESSPVKRGV